jgi:hypothetical protein
MFKRLLCSSPVVHFVERKGKPAIQTTIILYQKMGFQKIVGHATPYKRCNIQMELR